MFQLPWWSKANGSIADLMHPYIPASTEIVVVAIDNRTLQKIDDPYDGSELRKVVANAAAAGAKVIAIDHLFPSTFPGSKELKQTIAKTTTPVVVPAQLVDNAIIRSDLSKSYGYFASTVPNNDIIRMANLSVITNKTGSCVPSFSLAVVSAFRDTNNPVNCEQKVVLANGDQFPRQYPFRLTRGQFTTVSYTDVAQNVIPASTFTNKIVLIGSTSISEVDNQVQSYFTTVDKRYIPRIELRAIVINSLVQNKYLAVIPPLLVYGILIFLTHGLLFVGRLVDRAFLVSLSFLGITLVTLAIGALLVGIGYQWDFIGTVVIFLNTFVYLLMYRRITMQKYNNFIHTAFSHHIHPQRLNELLLDPQKLQLGGEQRVVTVVFVDIRNYTGLSERLTPKQLVGFTNRYLDLMSQIIMKHGGTIDKFIGDSIMAFWNAPLLDPDHRRRAVLCALDMSERIDSINNDYSQISDLRMGIGINTGPVIVGNVGGKNRFDYTILGDNVNLTHRLEGLTKFYQVPIISTRPIPWKTDIPNVVFRILDKVTVKGRKKPTVLYQPMRDTPENQSLKEGYEEAWLQYQDGNFRKAERIFEELPDDPAAQLMLKRISILKKRKDLELWNGIWEWSEK